MMNLNDILVLFNVVCRRFALASGKHAGYTFYDEYVIIYFVYWKYSLACETNSQLLLSFIVTPFYLSSTSLQHFLPTNGHMGSVLNCVLFIT